MNDNSQTREELITALQELTKKYDALRISYKNQIGIQMRIENELEHTQRKAEKSEHLKMELLKHLLHAVRGPVGGILGFAELVNYPDLTEEERIEFTGMIKNCAKRIIHQTDRMFTIESLKSGRLKPELSNTNITLILDDIYKGFIGEVEAKGLKLILKNSLTTETTIIKSDYLKVSEILAIIVENAIKNTSNGTIEVGCAKMDNDILFWVNDTGTGMSEAMKAFILEPHGLDDKPGGFEFGNPGEGLYIARAYIEMLGGSFNIESEQDKGSTFFFKLPASPNL
jgi:signal transduction histidine kinase